MQQEDGKGVGGTESQSSLSQSHQLSVQSSGEPEKTVKLGFMCMCGVFGF